MAQKHIIIYNSSGDVVADIDEVISATLTDRLDGELTLTFETLSDRFATPPDDALVEFDGQYYRITQVSYNGIGTGYALTISCEQESISLVDMEIDNFSFGGTVDNALARILDGTGMTGSAPEYTETIALELSNTNRRAVLLAIVEACGGEIEYAGHGIKIVSRRGRVLADQSPVLKIPSAAIPATVTSFTNSTDDGTVSYTAVFRSPDVVRVGDSVFVRLQNPIVSDKTKRITGITYNPFDCVTVTAEIGEQVRDITDEVAESSKLYLLRSDANAEFEKYINSAEGTASLKSSLSGAYVTADEAENYVQTSELDTSIQQYLNGEEGKASIVSAVSGEFLDKNALDTALDGYAKTTEVSASISQSISAFESSLTLTASKKSSESEKTYEAEMTFPILIWDDDTGTGYVFIKQSDGFYQSGNTGVDKSFAYGVYDFNFAQSQLVNFVCLQSSENNYDYGIISTVDGNVAMSYSTSDDDIHTTFKGDSATSYHTIAMTIPAGKHSVTVKYVKDTSNSSGDDVFKIRCLYVVTEEASSQTSTLTLKSGSVDISSADITFDGLVTFTSLKTAGATQINGANIITDTLTVNDVYLSSENSRKILTSELDTLGGTVKFGFIEDYGSSSYAKDVIVYANNFCVVKPGGSITDDYVATISPKSKYFGVSNESKWTFELGY